MELVNNDSHFLLVPTSHRNITSISNTLVDYVFSVFPVFKIILYSTKSVHGDGSPSRMLMSLYPAIIFHNLGRSSFSIYANPVLYNKS